MNPFLAQPNADFGDLYSKVGPRQCTCSHIAGCRAVPIYVNALLLRAQHERLTRLVSASPKVWFVK